MSDHSGTTRETVRPGFKFQISKTGARKLIFYAFDAYATKLLHRDQPVSNNLLLINSYGEILW